MLRLHLMDLKTAILSNPFIDTLRTELAVDRASFNDLCAHLKALREEWKGKSQVDKELVQELVGLMIISAGMAKSFALYQPDLVVEVEEMAVELEGLVLDCLS